MSKSVFSSPSLAKHPGLDEWVSIGADGRISIHSGKVDIGRARADRFPHCDDYASLSRPAPGPVRAREHRPNAELQQDS